MLIVLCVISLLVMYMFFLLFLEPMIRRRKLVGAYVEHTNEEVCSLMEPTMSDSGSFVSPTNALPICLKKNITMHNSSFSNVP